LRSSSTDLFEASLFLESKRIVRKGHKKKIVGEYLVNGFPKKKCDELAQQMG